MIALAWRLLAIAATLAPARVSPTNGSKLVSYALSATVLEGASADDAALAVAWAIFESAGDPRAVSPDRQDCSIMQLRGPARDGHTCDELTADPVLAIRVWLRWLGKMRTACHDDDARALGALSTGRCGGAPALVRRRMKVASIGASSAS